METGIKLSEAADLVGGKIFGNDNLLFNSLAKIEDAQTGDLTFLYLPAYEKFFPHTKASAILVKPGFNRTRDDITYIETEDPNKAFYKILVAYFTPAFPLEGIDPSASVHTSAQIGKNVSLGKNVVISANCIIGDNTKIFHNTVILENSEIGEDSLIFQNVSIREKCKIGKRAVIHSGTVIGSDGFGFYQDEKGSFKKIHQIGAVIIGDDVEIGSNTSIDRASIGATVIHNGVKIDNLVQIAHSVVIGENTIISAQAGISGSTKIGKNCYILGQAGLTGHIEIGDGVTLIAQSGVSKSILKPGVYFGSPAKELKTAFKIESHIRSLPDYAAKIKQMEEKIKELEEKLKS
ncbi:MAG: UDP-3-O-(3-hydroxymyristoyl)glucosamine N-acyltransferase [Ignavibacteriaceae bacterium]